MITFIIPLINTKNIWADDTIFIEGETKDAIKYALAISKQKSDKIVAHFLSITNMN